MHLGPEKIIEMRKDYILPCLNFFYKNPPQFVRGEMQYLYDHKGRKYLDFFSGVSVMSCGHSNPFIIEKTIEQLRQLQHVCNIYLTQPVAELAQKLASILPGDIGCSFFCNSGSEALDGAMLLARVATGKKRFIVLNGSLHGRTHLTLSATAIPMWRPDPFLDNDNFLFINPDIAELESVLKKEAGSIAALLAEPIQGNGGIVPAPLGFFKEAKSVLEKHGALMIIDEVQTGFGRTGKMFCIENYNTVPDIMAYSKAMGNGIPIGAFSTTKVIAQKFAKPSASTLGGNPVSCATALAVIEYIEKNNLVAQAKELGEYTLGRLVELQQKYHFIKSVRGMGLMLGAELEDEKGNPMPEAVDRILEDMKDSGVIIGKNGINRNVLAFLPPLVINRSDIDFFAENLDKALAAELKKH